MQFPFIFQLKTTTVKFLLRSVILFLCIVFFEKNARAQQNGIQAATDSLGKKHAKTEQWFWMETRVMKYSPDGTREDSDVYRLWLHAVPAGDGDDFTCLRFTVRSKDAEAYSIPILANWIYHISATPKGHDEKGQLLGIDHDRFEKLKDSSGKRVPIEQSYLVYNAFIDFHSLFIFSEKTDGGNGVQDLHQVGDKIVHAAAFSEPEVNLGSQIAEGSHFKNGEITLEWKGMGWVNNKRCALLGYDSGQSSFFMITKPFPLITVKTKGSSHYFGDIYKDVESGWIEKGDLHEIVVSETNVPGQSKPIHSVIERSLKLLNLGRNPF